MYRICRIEVLKEAKNNDEWHPGPLYLHVAAGMQVPSSRKEATLKRINGDNGLARPTAHVQEGTRIFYAMTRPYQESRVIR